MWLDARDSTLDICECTATATLGCRALFPPLKIEQTTASQSWAGSYTHKTKPFLPRAFPLATCVAAASPLYQPEEQTVGDVTLTRGSFTFPNHKTFTAIPLPSSHSFSLPPLHTHTLSPHLFKICLAASTSSVSSRQSQLNLWLLRFHSFLPSTRQPIVLAPLLPCSAWLDRLPALPA